MFKPTPNPPEADDVSPYETADSKKLNDAAERALDFHFPSNADIKATPRTRSALFSVDPQATTETLAVYLVETLASVDVMEISWWTIWKVSRVMRFWVFRTASWWRRLRRIGCWTTLIRS
jgi:hypothetical protein